MQLATVVPINLQGTDLRQQVESQKSVRRTMTLHSILIKNIDEWEKKKAMDVTGGTAHAHGGQGAPSEDGGELKLNEEVKIVEYAPAIF